MSSPSSVPQSSVAVAGATHRPASEPFRRALGQLDEPARLALALRYDELLSVREIGYVLDLTVAETSRLLRRAVKALQGQGTLEPPLAPALAYAR